MDDTDITRYADNIVIIAKQNKNLYDDRTTVRGRGGLNMNRQKTKVMTNSEQPLNITIDEKQIEQVGR